MTNIKQDPESTDTSSSFYSKNTFQYRNNEINIDYVFALQNQKDAVRNLCRNTPVTEDKILSLLTNFQAESNQFIKRLLDDLANQHKKSRITQDHCEKMMRDKGIECRRLSQLVVELTAALQGERKSGSTAKSRLEGQIVELKSRERDLQYQMEGMKKLLNQYEEELMKLSTYIEKQERIAKEQQQSLQTQSQIAFLLKSQLNAICQQYSQVFNQCDEKDRKLKEQTDINAQLQQKLSTCSKMIDEFKIRERECSSGSIIIKQKDTYIQQLQRQLLAANEKAAKYQETLAELTVQAKEKQNEIDNKQTQYHEKFRALEERTKDCMTQLKQGYQKKITKILNLLNKQVRCLRNFVDKSNLIVQKQMLKCLKLSKADGSLLLQIINK